MRQHFNLLQDEPILSLYDVDDDDLLYVQKCYRRVVDRYDHSVVLTNQVFYKIPIKAKIPCYVEIFRR